MNNDFQHQGTDSDPYAFDLVWREDQEALTESHIVPQLDTVLNLFRQLRSDVDNEFNLKKTKLGRFGGEGLSLDTYPFGWCMIINQEVYKRAKKQEVIKNNFVVTILSLKKDSVITEAIKFKIVSGISINIDVCKSYSCN